jgi:hypothetical protein
VSAPLPERDFSAKSHYGTSGGLDVSPYQYSNRWQPSQPLRHPHLTDAAQTAHGQNQEAQVDSDRAEKTRVATAVSPVGCVSEQKCFALWNQMPLRPEQRL